MNSQNPTQLSTTIATTNPPRSPTATPASEAHGMTLIIVWCLMVLMLSLCVYAQADDAQAAWSKIIAKCINDPDAQCDFDDFPTSWSVDCIDDPSSACNNWYGPQVSAKEKAQREAAARGGEESPNLIESKARAKNYSNGSDNGSDLSHCVGLLDGVSDVRDKTKDWLGSNRATDFKAWSFNHIQTNIWFDFVSTGVSKVKMKFEGKDIEDNPFSGLTTAELKNSNCSVLSMDIRIY